MEYGNDDIESYGQHYFKHVSAMTVEALHSKSDIAAELAYRDCEIEKLRAELKDCHDAYQGCYADFQDCHADYQDCAKHLHKANFEVTHLKLQLAEMQSAFVDGYDKAKNEYRPMVHKLEDQRDELVAAIEKYLDDESETLVGLHRAIAKCKEESHD